MQRVWVALVSLLAVRSAHADTTVTVTLSNEGQMLAQAMGISTADLAMQVKSKIDDAYQTARINGFLKEFTDATSFSQRGIGVDYSSAPTNFMVGMAANLAVAGNPDIHDKQHITGGLAANFSIMLGMNLSEWGHEKWTVFANGFYQEASLGDLEGSITSAGAHLQYNLLEPAKTGGAATLVRWLGLSLTSGIEYTRWNFGTGGTELTTPFELSGGGMTVPVSFDSTGRFDLRSNAVTVPIEASTGIRLALIASLFVGAGIDLTPAGRSTLDAGLNGNVRTEDGRDLGAVTITGDGDSKGSPGQFRLLAGGQVNLWKLKIFVQANVSQAPAASVALGLKFVNWIAMPEATEDVLANWHDNTFLEAYRIDGLRYTGDARYLGVVGISSAHPVFHAGGLSGELSSDSRFMLMKHQREGKAPKVFVVFRQFASSPRQAFPEDVLAGWVPAEREADAQTWVDRMNTQIDEFKRARRSL